MSSWRICAAAALAIANLLVSGSVTAQPGKDLKGGKSIKELEKDEAKPKGSK